jgi:hypothetical protein
MTFRERFLRTIGFKPVDRLPERHAYGLMPGVLEAWYKQGLPASVTTDNDIVEYFAFPPASVSLPIDMGPVPAFEERILEDTEEHRIAIDRWGRKTRIMKGVTTIALGKEFPVTDLESWLPYKERLAGSVERIGENLEEAARKNLAGGGINQFGAMGFYWFPRDLMGDEALAVAYYEDPDLVHSINDTWCTLMEDVLHRVLSRIDLDVVHLNEDMAYKNASMIGRRQFDEFMVPYYTRLAHIVEAHDTPVFSVDSDGFLGELCEWFSACGVNLIGPNEVRAGNDIGAYRKRFDQTLAFDGGIDKLVLPEGRSVIDRMLERIVPPMMDSGGGWVVSLDHRVVPGTTLADFSYYLDRVRKLTTFE